MQLQMVKVRNVMNIGKINAQNPSFGYKTIIDIGASNPKGTCKVLVKSDDGRDLFKKNCFLNDTTKGFKTHDAATNKTDGGQADFIKKLDNVIFNASNELREKAHKGEIQLAKGADGSFNDDAKLSGVAVFVPGTTFTYRQDDRIAFMPNLKNDKGEAIVDVDFKSYEKDIKASKSRPFALELNPSKDFELIVTKDLGGAGLAIAQIMAQQDKLNPGDYIMGVMTGGGFGSVDIKVKGDYAIPENQPRVEIETSESSSYLSGNVTIYETISDKLEEILKMDNPKNALIDLVGSKDKFQDLIPVLGKLGRQGVSVKSHIATFLKELKLNLSDADYDKLIALTQRVGDARIVSNNTMYVSSSDMDLYNEIKSSPFFKEVKSDVPNKHMFSMNDKIISPQVIKKARIQTVNDYANAVSLISINKINDCINKVVLVGPFAQGLNKHVREHQEDYGAKDLTDLIMNKIKTNIDEEHVDLPSTRWLLDLYNFEIICDKSINFPDNTYAGDLLLKHQLSFTPNRGSWFEIPLSVLKEKPAEKSEEKSKK